MKHQLSQQEIDSVFDAATGAHPPAGVGAVPFDFRRLDRIPKSQVSAIHFLYEAFVKSLSTSLSVYLRTSVAGSLISVEQLPYSDFADALPAPTCLVYATMDPYQGHALIEVSPTLIAPVLDLVLGGSGQIKMELDRGITEVEKLLLEGFFHLVTQDLREIWKPVAEIAFGPGIIETSPQLSGRFVANEAVVAVAMEFRIGESVGMVNMAIPSITLKTMGQRFDQQWANQRPENAAITLAIKQKLGRHLQVTVDCEYSGATLKLKDFLDLTPGDVFTLGPAFREKVEVLVNGTAKFRGSLASSPAHTLTVIVD